MMIAWNSLLLLVGFACLIFGADRLVQGSVALATRLRISQMMIGLTIVSIGTSMPELIISLLGSMEGSTGIALGNVIGSNICNTLLILGVSGLIAKRPLGLDHVTVDLLVAALGAVMLLLFSLGGSLSRVAGACFFLLFVLYMVRLIRLAGQPKEKPMEQDLVVEALSHPVAIETEQVMSIAKSVMLLLVGLAGLLLGGKAVVYAATEIAYGFGMSEKIVGLTIVAIGTSLPELVTCIAAVSQGKPDLAIGNVVGSNILNLYFILGTTLLISPMVYDKAFTFDLLVLLASALMMLLFLLLGTRHKLDRWEAGLLLGGYVGYLTYSVTAAMG